MGSGILSHLVTSRSRGTSGRRRLIMSVSNLGTALAAAAIVLATPSAFARNPHGALCETDNKQVAYCTDSQFHNGPHLRFIEGCTDVAPMTVVKWGDNTFVCSGNQHRKSPYD